MTYFTIKANYNCPGLFIRVIPASPPWLLRYAQDDTPFVVILKFTPLGLVRILVYVLLTCYNGLEK